MTWERKQVCERDAEEMKKFFLKMYRRVHEECEQQIQRQEEESEMNNGDMRLLLSGEEVQEYQ